MGRNNVEPFPRGIADLQDLCGLAVLPRTRLHGISADQEKAVYSIAKGNSGNGAEFGIPASEVSDILKQAGVHHESYSSAEGAFLYSLIIARQSHQAKPEQAGWSVMAMQGLVFESAKSEGREEALRVLKELLALS